MLSRSIHNCFITRTERHVTAVNLQPVAIICCLPPQSPGSACTSHALTFTAKEQSATLRTVYLLSPLKRKDGYKQGMAKPGFLVFPWSSSVAYPILGLHLTTKVYPVLNSPSSSLSSDPTYSDLQSQLHYFISFFLFLHRFQNAVYGSLL